MYSYCQNNPVSNVDPLGYLIRQLQYLRKKIKEKVEQVVTILTRILNSHSKEYEENKRPYIGEPGSKYVAPNGDWRIYGPDGKPLQDYDHDDHKFPATHPHDENGGHYHDWENGKRGKAYVPESHNVGKGIGLIVLCGIGILVIAADDIIGFGTADDPLAVPLSSGFASGISLLFG